MNKKKNKSSENNYIDRLDTNRIRYIVLLRAV